VKTSYRKRPVLAIEDLGLELDELRGDPIEELARFGAELVLTSYLHAAVAEHLGADRYERDARRRGWRNGCRTRRVTCGTGSLNVDFPKVRGSSEAFRSRALDAWQRKSDTIASTMASLYVEGLSTRDYERALSPLWGEAGLSRSTVSRANEQVKEAFEAWRRRDLSQEEVVYLFLDGHSEGIRLGTREKEAILVAHGITRTGARRLLGVYLGCRESADSWRLALRDLVARGLATPLLVISDGCPGLIRAVNETWPKIARQRCVVHRIRNVLARAPKSAHKLLQQAMNRIFYAPCPEEALAAAQEFAERFGDAYPEATRILGEDLADCLTFFRFPSRHWRRLRTSNMLERTFKEVKRRTRVIGRFPGEMAALSLVWSVIDRQASAWHGIRMDDAHVRLSEAAVESLIKEPIEVKGFEELLAA
jgi:putative transposase